MPAGGGQDFFFREIFLLSMAALSNCKAAAALIVCVCGDESRCFILTGVGWWVLTPPR